MPDCSGLVACFNGSLKIPAKNLIGCARIFESSIFEQTRPEQSHGSPRLHCIRATERRLHGMGSQAKSCKENTARLAEAGGWIGRVKLERAIGDMVSQVCRETPLAFRTGHGIDRILSWSAVLDRAPCPSIARPDVIRQSRSESGRQNSRTALNATKSSKRR